VKETAVQGEITWQSALPSRQLEWHPAASGTTVQRRIERRILGVDSIERRL
jgi:hypothetical protein